MKIWTFAKLYFRFFLLGFSNLSRTIININKEKYMQNFFKSESSKFAEKFEKAASDISVGMKENRNNVTTNWFSDSRNAFPLTLIGRSVIRSSSFVNCMKQHRKWNRTKKRNLFLLILRIWFRCFVQLYHCKNNSSRHDVSKLKQLSWWTLLKNTRQTWENLNSRW